MSSNRKRLSLVGLALGLLLPLTTDAQPVQEERDGVLRVVTYNVAGLPEGLSRLHPRETLPQIGALLNRYDVALVQEDFAYPHLLRERITLPFGSPLHVRESAFDFGDGLSQFSRLPFNAPERIAWTTCHGYTDAYFDCLVSKGVASTSIRLASGHVVDVYNVHLDAGNSAGDRAARNKQLEELTRVIRERSAGHAVILGGDFNLSPSERSKLGALESALGIRDACTTLRCPEPWRIDRILVRSSNELRLVPQRWHLDLEFHDARGKPLSDHFAVAVELRWIALPAMQAKR